MTSVFVIAHLSFGENDASKTHLNTHEPVLNDENDFNRSFCFLSQKKTNNVSLLRYSYEHGPPTGHDEQQPQPQPQQDAYYYYPYQADPPSASIKKKDIKIKRKKPSKKV